MPDESAVLSNLPLLKHFRNASSGLIVELLDIYVRKNADALAGNRLAYNGKHRFNSVGRFSS